MDPATAISQAIDEVRNSWMRVGTVTNASVPGQVTVDLAGAELTVPTLNSYAPLVGDSVKIIVWNGQKLAIGKPGPYIPGSAGGPHSHVQSEVANLPTSLAGKSDTGHTHAGIGAHAHSETDVTGLTDDLTQLNTGLATKSDTGHTHPSGAHAHTEADVTGLSADLDSKAASVHAHTQANVTNLTTDLAGKAASVHAHAQGDVTNLATSLAAKSDTTHTHEGVGGDGSPADTAQYSSTGQSFTTGVTAEVAWATADRAVTGITRATRGTGHQFTLATAGTYTITVTLRFAGFVGSRIQYMELREATAGVCGASAVTQAEGGPATWNLAVTRYFPAGAVVWVGGYQNTGGNQSLDTGESGWNRINITYVSGVGSGTLVSHIHPESEVTNLTSDLAALTVAQAGPTILEAPATTFITTVTTTATDLAGCSITFTTLAANTVVLIDGIFDTECNGSTDVLIGQLVVDGAPQTTGQAIQRLTGRAMACQRWKITLATAGTHVAKLQVSKANNTNTLTVQQIHSKIIVQGVIVPGVLHQGAATLAGVGQLTATGVSTDHGQTNLAGVGQLTAAATVTTPAVHAGAATLAGLGQLTAAATVTAGGGGPAAAPTLRACISGEDSDNASPMIYHPPTAAASRSRPGLPPGT